MAFFAIHYTYTPATASLRDQYRPAHRAWLGEHFTAGNVLLSGAYPDGSGALIVVRAADLDAATAFIGNDPFLTNDAVDGVRVVEWNQVYGPFED
ncbi:MAG: YciI family protein [Gordonia sp. (in: high G+C Gram-positive bacteria)]